MDRFAPNSLRVSVVIHGIVDGKPQCSLISRGVQLHLAALMCQPLHLRYTSLGRDQNVNSFDKDVNSVDQGERGRLR